MLGRRALDRRSNQWSFSARRSCWIGAFPAWVNSHRFWHAPLSAAFSLVLRLPVPVRRPRRPRSDIWATGTTAWALAVTRWQSSLAHPPPAQPSQAARSVWPSPAKSGPVIILLLSRSSSFPQILLLCSHPPTVLVRTVSCPGSPSLLSFACNSNFLSRPKNPESSPLTSFSISDTCSTACDDF